MRSVAALLLFPFAALAHTDRSQAPYLYSPNAATGEVEKLPLRESHAEIEIVGVIAHVTMHQVFQNSGTTPIDAVYVFPASTRAAVHGMRMKIGARVVEAKIERRETARQLYEQARVAERRAALVEEERPNVFSMNVTNVQPKDVIDIELEYTEMVIPEENTYEFVYPTVVGPRYSASSSEKWISNPHLPAGKREPHPFALRVHVQTGIALKELTSPSHDIAVTYESPTSARVALSAHNGGNRDFVLRYRLAGNRIETGALFCPSDSKGDGFFAVMMEPPARPTLADVPPREYVFLLDVSGSMRGFPIQTAQTLMQRLLTQLRPSDYFNVVAFAGTAAVLSPSGSLRATPEEVTRALGALRTLRGGGGTELLDGLKNAYGIPSHPGVSRSVVVISDGFVGVERDVFRFIRERLDEANLFSFGIGSSVNRYLMEGMARAGMGEPFIVLKAEEARAQAARVQKIVEQPVLTDIAVQWKGLEISDVIPEKIPDLFARRPIVLFGKFHGAAHGSIELTGTSGGGPYRQVVAVDRREVRPANAPLRWLWARKWVERFEDEANLYEQTRESVDEIDKTIEALGLDYRLLTRRTSFIAVDSVPTRNAAGPTVRQPLPLPTGVSNSAVLAQAPPAQREPAPSMPAPETAPPPSTALKAPSGGRYGRGCGCELAPATSPADGATVLLGAFLTWLWLRRRVSSRTRAKQN